MWPEGDGGRRGWAEVWRSFVLLLIGKYLGFLSKGLSLCSREINLISGRKKTESWGGELPSEKVIVMRWAQGVMGVWQQLVGRKETLVRRGLEVWACLHLE